MNISNKEDRKNFEIIPGTKIGKDPMIGSFVILGTPAKTPTKPLEIGDYPTIRSHSIIYSGNTIGDNFQTGHSAFIQENNQIGNQVSLGTKSVILSNCTIDDRVRIHTQVFIPEFSIIKKNAWIGPKVVLTNTRHPKCKHAKECLKNDSVKIGENAILGANATILPGVIIGKGAFIGAGSVVTRDIPENTVVVGNPARTIKKANEFTCPFDIIDRPYT